jgi:hypothetical protein
MAGLWQSAMKIMAERNGVIVASANSNIVAWLISFNENKLMSQCNTINENINQ